MRRRTRGYDPEEAHVRARARMWSGSRLDRDDDLRESVLALLMRSRSPEQVSGHLKREAGKPVISYESIYATPQGERGWRGRKGGSSAVTMRNTPLGSPCRAADRQTPGHLGGRSDALGHSQAVHLHERHTRLLIGPPPRHSQITRENNFGWRICHARSGWRGRKGGSSTVTIAKRRPLAERPAEAADRQTPGHWEADLMLFRRHSQAVLALHERHTRLLIAVRLPGKGADHIASAMTQVLSAFPPAMRRSVTFDNGTEFARRHRLHDLGVQTFFCDTYSPWQKGGVENAIGRMRRFLTRKTDLATLDGHQFDLLVQMYNVG